MKTWYMKLVWHFPWKVYDDAIDDDNDAHKGVDENNVDDT